MKNILITGGAGFIGSNLALTLIRRGYAVSVLDNLSPQIHGAHSSLYESIRNKVTFIHGDVRNKHDWQKALLGQDAVIHLAAETGTGQSMYEIEKYTEVNITATAIFLDLLANEPHTIKKIVVASSRSIYGEGKYRCSTHGIVYPTERQDNNMSQQDFHVKCPFCIENVTLLATDEESKIHPSSLYGITKQVQEQMVLTIGKALNIPSVAFRYQNVYGPGQSLSNPYTGILSIFSTRIKNNNPIAIFEDGKESRDFVYIDDAVEATILGLENEKANFEAFNVGSGERTNVLTVAKTLKKAYGSDIDITVTGNYRVGDIRDNFADLTKIKNLLGFEPKINFSVGISKFVSWVENQEIKSDNYDLSMEEMKQKGFFK